MLGYTGMPGGVSGHRERPIYVNLFYKGCWDIGNGPYMLNLF
jgi:hypothetical protein